jgi:hypothetical protein
MPGRQLNRSLVGERYEKAFDAKEEKRSGGRESFQRLRKQRLPTPFSSPSEMH